MREIDLFYQIYIYRGLEKRLPRRRIRYNPSACLGDVLPAWIFQGRLAGICYVTGARRIVPLQDFYD